MNKLVLSLSVLYVVQQADPSVSLRTLEDAVMYVESRGDTSAYNVQEDAVGCLQIRPIMVREVNRVLGSEVYTLDDRWSRQCSLEMFRVMAVQVDKAEHPNYEEVVARRWNGGARGERKSATLGYWRRVEKKLKK
jgi:hypothetical protein